MRFKLEASTLNETVECRENFSCLTGDKSCLCEVENVINDRLLFVKLLNHNGCHYKTSFGYSHFCNCPARMEIYKRYKS